MATGLSVRSLDSKTARETCEREHYLHRKPVVSHAFGLYNGEQLMGVVTFGTPASRHLQLGADPENPSQVIELNRLWIDDAMPKNTGSWFVARAFKMMPPFIVVSYADTVQGHLGYVYRAMNFHYSGWTDMERRTPRLDYIPMTEGAHTRGAASRSGVRETVRRRPKVKYWTVTGDKSERRRLRSAMRWPVLDWNELPPPTEHRFHRLSA